MGYPSDITKEQFESIRPILESARKKTAPRKLDLYDIFNGLLYIVDNGCKWHALPHDYPKYKSVHYYFMIWSKKRKGEKESILEQVLKKIGWWRAYEQWQEDLDVFYYHRRPERKEHRHSTT